MGLSWGTTLCYCHYIHALAICLEREPKVMRWIFCQYSSLACLASVRRDTVAGSEFHNASDRRFSHPTCLKKD
ncbi:hypothetical protein LZ32DRAFT_63003 [Colletotrichum eremochloae]|nr:hypothetical protein LZ32DRAFT_63003 [Colletotrichum eremochloae]